MERKENGENNDDRKIEMHDMKRERKKIIIKKKHMKRELRKRIIEKWKGSAE